MSAHILLAIQSLVQLWSFHVSRAGAGMARASLVGQNWPRAGPGLAKVGPRGEAAQGWPELAQGWPRANVLSSWPPDPLGLLWDLII